MTVGFIMLCHEALDRAAQVASHWADRGCPLVIHVDKRVSAARFERFRTALARHDNIVFSSRVACEWGTWSLVSATLRAAEVMLDRFPEAKHVFMVSGTCLPLRSVADLKTYLADRPDTSFIESVTTADVSWTKGGLDSERFTLRFPFSWKRQRRLFDAYVRLQRRMGVKRRLPYGIRPHMGSQWWCLTRRALKAILEDPRRGEFERYFRRVWIPDESYFQTLVRLHPGRVESRSLTLSKFDFQGKPHIFYDDHLQLLRRSDCFVARKIWPQANRLYDIFLTDRPASATLSEPNPGKIDRIFTKATERRIRGRAGLYMASRFPLKDYESGRTCARYTVFEGFGDLFHDFPGWLQRATGVRAHGHLFAPERVEFTDDQRSYAGALSDSASLRDYNPRAFLTNLIWNTRGDRQAFLFGPRDNQRIAEFIAYDSNAEILIITGCWAVPLFKSDAPFSEVRREAARLQKIEAAHVDLLRDPHVKARVRVWSMADFVESPLEPLQSIAEETGVWQARNLTEAPRMIDLTGFGQFLQNLKNEGMNPYMMGDFSSGDGPDLEQPEIRKPYIVR